MTFFHMLMTSSPVINGYAEYIIIIKTFVRSYVYVISFEGNIYRQSSFIAGCLMGEKEDKLEIQHGERRDFDEDTCLSSW